MIYERFIREYLEKGLIKKQKPSINAVSKIIQRSIKDLTTAKANLNIDEAIAYSVAYLGMLRAGRAFMLLKGFRPSDGFQHKTVVDFMDISLGETYKNIVSRFDKMRRKRNIFTYEIDVSITMTEANNALETATQFVDLIKNIIKKENPQSQLKF
jgi:uncharacterized protein (UPF0332 family)